MVFPFGASKKVLDGKTKGLKELSIISFDITCKDKQILAYLMICQVDHNCLIQQEYLNHNFVAFYTRVRDMPLIDC